MAASLVNTASQRRSPSLGMVYEQYRGVRDMEIFLLSHQLVEISVRATPCRTICAVVGALIESAIVVRKLRLVMVTEMLDAGLC